MTEIAALLKRQEVERLVGLGHAAIYARMNPSHPQYDPSFPKPVPVSGPINKPVAVRWVSTEVQEWIKARIAARDTHQAA